MPLIHNKVNEVNEEIFAEQNYIVTDPEPTWYEPLRAVRTSRYKYIRRYDKSNDTLRWGTTCDFSLNYISHDFWKRHGWRELPIASEQLFDLIFDPNEAATLVGESHMKEVLTDMRDRLDRWMHRTDDPLLNGPIPPPKKNMAS